MFKTMSVWKKIIIAILVLIPIILGFLWWNYIREAERAALGNFLAPVDNTPIIITLVIFMGGYILFLFGMFYDNINDFVYKTTKKK